jgi:hypothetical protein
MSDRLKLAREIAARTEPHFMHTRSADDTGDLKVLPRATARKPARFVTIHRHRGGSTVFNEGELTAQRGGLTAEEYRWKTIRKWGGR